MNVVSSAIRWCAKHAGYSLVRCQSANGFPRDFDEFDIDVVREVGPFTKTTPERIYALIQAVRYLVQHRVPGAYVECGVWLGGSMMAVARVLQQLQHTDGQLYLYDTFEGMVKPTEVDVASNGVSALTKFSRRQVAADSSDWCFAPLDRVQELMAATGYPLQQMHFIKGKVEQTLPQQAPSQIAFLRLDTDWYESTRHELVHLFPRLSPGGVLIIDDYGDWLGARKAVDEYFAEHGIRMLLTRIDDSARLGVKL